MYTKRTHFLKLKMGQLEKTLGHLIHTGYIKTSRGRRKIQNISKILKNPQQRHKEKSTKGYVITVLLYGREY